MASESRSYEILGLLGTGGFGKVYRARLSGGSDFSKDVAIKVLHDEDPDPDLLKRFRDEARILGLIRDRAIVSVDPPTRLGNRWAVVMDYVDGVSCAALLKRHGPLSPGVVIEIIGEVARVLHKAYHFERPDGGPLELLHRDIKPANVQVTPGGEVRLLDFGVARANFSSREALTVDAISGTPGYMAPERFSGIEGPAGDVYSLGVLAWMLLTGERAGKRGPIDLRECAVTEFVGERSKALVLAAEMRLPDHRDRPSARDAERRCRSLRRAFEEPFLREFAEEHVRSMPNDGDELVGSVLSDTLFGASVNPHGAPTVLLDSADEPSQTSRRGLMVGGVVLSGATALAVVLGTLLAAGIGLWWWQSFPAPEPEPVVHLRKPGADAFDRGRSAFAEGRYEDSIPHFQQAWDESQSPDMLVQLASAQQQIGDLDAAVANLQEYRSRSQLDDTSILDRRIENLRVRIESRKPVEVDPEPDAVVEVPAPAPPRAKPAPVRKPVRQPKKVLPEPAPEAVEPVEPAPAPSPAVKTFPVSFRSVPWNASVKIDGVNRGVTPISDLALTSGTHQVEMNLGEDRIERTLKVGRRAPDDHLWRVLSGEFASGFRSTR